ncbi:MAG TPA: response regulator [Nitrososphaeraceae archaeon]|nr:response regulator [Nitrososphaeraceae archaeon]
MRFNAKKTSNLDSFSSLFDINRLITIDTTSVDDHSRLTLTRKIKKVLPVMPKDTITVYQDRYNKDLMVVIQHDESNTIDSFIIKTKSSSSRTKIFYDTKTIEEKKQQQQKEEERISNQQDIIKKKNTIHDINILIVDDEEDLLKVFEYFLKTEGYHNVEIFSDPKKVIKHFIHLKKEDYYELAIIDVRMPVINGIQLYQILTIIHPDIQVLFVTALDAASELTSLFKIKEEDIIKKPCTFDQFIKKINDVSSKVFESN